MQFERQPSFGGLDGGNQRARAVGRQQAGRVLDIDAVEIRGPRKVGRETRVEGVAVRVAQRIGQSTDDIIAAFLADDLEVASIASRSCIGSSTMKRDTPLRTRQR